MREQPRHRGLIHRNNYQLYIGAINSSPNIRELKFKPDNEVSYGFLRPPELVVIIMTKKRDQSEHCQLLLLHFRLVESDFHVCLIIVIIV